MSHIEIFFINIGIIQINILRFKDTRNFTHQCNIFKMQSMTQAAAHKNDFDLRLKSYESFLTFYFKFNMTNYARYGSFYVETWNA